MIYRFENAKAEAGHITHLGRITLLTGGTVLEVSWIESTIKKKRASTFSLITIMKFTNGIEKLEMHNFKSEKKNMQKPNSQSASIPIIHYDHEPRSLGRSSERMEYTLLQRPEQLFNSEMISLSEKDDTKENPRPILAGNEGPSMIVKTTVCVIAFIIMIICLCFLFV